jgi:hypothetical protein
MAAPGNMAGPSDMAENRCNDCQKAIPAGRRYCDACRRARRRKTKRQADAGRRRGATLTVRPTVKPDPVNTRVEGATGLSDANRRGLECRRCGCRHFEVVYTRPCPGGRILRRRECRHCGKRIVTWEREIGGPVQAAPGPARTGPQLP